jgi:DNA-binding MarR family transcriptional regulator
MPGRAAPTLPALVQLVASQANQHLRRDLERSGFADLRPVDAYLLVRLAAGPRRAADLAAETGVTPQAVAQVVHALESAGYVTRSADPTDGRAKLVRLTPRGGLTLVVVRRSFVALERRWAERLGERRLADLRDAVEGLLGERGP